MWLIAAATDRVRLALETDWVSSSHGLAAVPNTNMGRAVTVVQNRALIFIIIFRIPSLTHDQ